MYIEVDLNLQNKCIAEDCVQNSQIKSYCYFDWFIKLELCFPGVEGNPMKILIKTFFREGVNFKATFMLYYNTSWVISLSVG